MKQKYIVRLDSKERCRLEQIVGIGKPAAYRIRHANNLLAVNESEAGGEESEIGTGPILFDLESLFR